MPTYYAWSNIPIPVISDAGVTSTKTIAVGSEVSKGDIPDITDEDWNAMIAGGSVREQPYPKAIVDKTYGDSPNRFFRDQLVRAAEGDLSASELKELSAAGLTGDEETSTSGSAAEEAVKEDPTLTQ